MFRLALSLGVTVKELKQKIDVEEFIQWVAYYEVEPWGAKVDGIRQAVSASASANSGLMVAAPKKFKSHQFKAKDFYVGVVDPPREGLGTKKGNVNITESFFNLRDKLKSMAKLKERPQC